MQPKFLSLLLTLTLFFYSRIDIVFIAFLISHHFMFLFSFFLSFRLHSLKELSIKEQRNNFFLRNLTNQNDPNKFPIYQNSKKLKAVTNEPPLCGPFSGNLDWSRAFSGLTDKYHYCDYESTPFNGITFTVCNEYSHVAIADCTLHTKKILTLSPTNPYSSFLGIVRTVAGFPNGLFYLNDIESTIKHSLFHYCCAFNDGGNTSAGQLITAVGGSHTWQHLEFK